MENKIKASRKENKKISDDLSTNSETIKDEDFKKSVNKKLNKPAIEFMECYPKFKPATKNKIPIESLRSISIVFLSKSEL